MGVIILYIELKLKHVKPPTFPKLGKHLCREICLSVHVSYHCFPDRAKTIIGPNYLRGLTCLRHTLLLQKVPWVGLTSQRHCCPISMSLFSPLPWSFGMCWVEQRLLLYSCYYLKKNSLLFGQRILTFEKKYCLEFFMKQIIYFPAFIILA